MVQVFCQLHRRTLVYPIPRSHSERQTCHFGRRFTRGKGMSDLASQQTCCGSLQMSHSRVSFSASAVLTSFTAGSHRPRRHLSVFAAAETFAPSVEAPYILPGGIIDYYTLLGVEDDASFQEIKQAYRSLAKVCHPDKTSDSGRMCVLINEAYEVLSDPVERSAYNSQLDEALSIDEDGFTNLPLSKWCANTKLGKNVDPAEERAVFVDETTCIGCKQCVWVAPATFRIEDAYGRSRVFGQWLDTEENIQAAIGACPVSCIHWVSRQDLPALEHVCQNVMGRTNVGMMMAGQGGFIDDVFNATSRFLKEREATQKARVQAQQYSAKQEASRRAAAGQTMTRNTSWFSSFADRINMSFASGDWPSASSMDSDEEYSQYKKVGKRKRGSSSEDEEFEEALAADLALVVSSESKARWER